MIIRLLLLTVLCSMPVYGQYRQSVYDFDIKHWTTADGLSANSVRAISQDSAGYIWFGTLYGLNRFDGYQFDVFTTDNSRHLVSNAVTRLLADSQGYMWVGTKAGLSGFNPQTLKFDRYPVVGEVTSIIEIQPGEIWVAADNLFRIQQGKVSRVEDIKAQVNQLKMADGYIWASSTEYLYRMDLQGNITEFLLPPELAQTPVYELFWLENTLYIGSEAGYFKLADNGKISKCQLPDSSNTAVYKLFRDSHNNQWISAHRILFYQGDNQPWQQITVDELGSYPWFSDIFEDSDHNIWLASFSDGVFRAAKGNIRRVLPDSNEPVIRSLGVTPEQQLLVAGQSGVGIMAANGDYHTLITGQQLGMNTIHDLYWPDHDTLWLATELGVLSFSAARQTLDAIFPELQGRSVRVLQPAEEGGLWVGGVNGLFHYQQKLQPFHLNDELESHHITVLQQQAGMLIFGTTRGVYQYGNGRLNRLGSGSALYNSYITALLLLPDQTLVVSTLDDGMFIRRPNQSWYQFYSGNGLPQSPVVSLSYDDATDTIWVSSHQGIFRFAADKLSLLPQQRLAVDEILTPYDRQLGTVPGRCCNGSGHAKAVLWQQQYWFPTLKGLIAVPAELNTRTDKRRQPLIKQVKGRYEYTVSTQQSPIVLELNDRDLTIRFSALEFMTPAALQFRYQLAGYEDGWHYASDRREAIYTHLPPGTFRFRLEVKSEHEEWQPQQRAELELVIPKRFDESVLYRGLWLLLLLFSLYALFWLFRRNTLHKQHELERLVRQRTQELENSNLRLNELNEQLIHLTHKDSLTGLRNRRFMFEQLPKDVENFQRNRELMQMQKKCIALVHLDLDNFKQLNDQYGNSAGDSVIQQISGVLIRETRGSDYVVRFAGEEFILVLRDVPLESVKPFCYRLNEQVSGMTFSLPDGQRTMLTCSIGYAVYPLELLGGQLINWEISLQLAELALYQVKKNGKDSVASIVFDQQVDAFEFEDSLNIEEQVDKLLAAGLAWFEYKE
ncbi:diguanylate cyclase [Chromatiaceae bacterium AAb-1]|nr:diguanylate cyclase [Chromatiaceae bacterium AAb-1]